MMKRSVSGILFCATILAGTAIIGAFLSTAFWVLWFDCMGSIPKMQGYSRLWLDGIGFAIYLPAVVIYIWTAQDQKAELAESDDFYDEVSLMQFIFEKAVLLICGILLVIGFVTGIFFSFIAPAMVILIIAKSAFFIFIAIKLYNWVAKPTNFGINFMVKFFENIHDRMNGLQ